MSHHMHKALHRRTGVLPASGSVVESIPTPTASLLAQNSAAVADPNSTPTGIPLVSTSIVDNASTVAQSSTPTATASTSTSSGNQISLGTVIGACVAALIALLLAVALAFYCSKRQNRVPAYCKSRNAANNVSRRRSHLEAWKRMEDDEDQWEDRERREQSMKQRPPSGSLGAMFHRTTSTTTSGEKSSEGHNRESVGTMQHFAKYHPGLAAEMAAQGTGTGVDGKIAKPPPVLHLMGRSLDMTPPISWDGETVGGDSPMSLHMGLSNPMASHMMATERLTPPATFSSLHRWEKAEVVHVSQVDSDLSDVGELRNPFADSASSVKSGSSKGQNPFFSARDHHARRTLLPDSSKNPFADTNSTRDSSSALRSLIAALEEPQRLSDDRIASVQSSVYSRATGDDGDSAISVRAFPYPPAQINLR